ncbi:MAG: hypothetical protein ACRC1D_05955 [Culicoidibacterales bacterium]
MDVEINVYPDPPGFDAWLDEHVEPFIEPPIEIGLSDLSEDDDVESVTTTSTVSNATQPFIAEIENEENEDDSQTQCFICYKHTTLTTTCCRQPVHLFCLGYWQQKSKDDRCPYCREIKTDILVS